MNVQIKTLNNSGTKEIENKYENAQRLMQGILSKNLVFNATVIPTWISDSDSFWYCRETQSGKEYRIVDANKATNDIAFDHSVLAKALGLQVSEKIETFDLPIMISKIMLNPLRVVFSAFDKNWIFSRETNSCSENKKLPAEWVISPDGKQALVVRDFNLWVHDISSGEEKALTHDGEDHFAYGAFGSAWGGVPGGDGVMVPQVLWSPDGKKILTAQRDRRKVKELPIVHHVPQDGSTRPTVEFAKVSYPGDEHIETLRVLAIDVESGRLQEANYRQIPVTRSDWGLIDSNLAWWGPDSQRAYFVDMERDYKTVRVVAFDTSNGEVSPLFKETSTTQINLMLNSDERPTFMPLSDTNELLWFSERSGWAHLYLYNLDSGELKTSITQGEWVVRDLVSFDAKRRDVFIQTSGRVPIRDPYYRDLVRVNIDSGELTTIASSDHEIWAFTQKNFSADLIVEFGMEINDKACAISESGHFALVNRSRVDEAPVTILFDRDGNEVLEVETADISGLPANWQWPEPVKLLAADGKTDIYGVVYRPSDFSPAKSYPIIDYAFKSPEYPYAAKGSFASGLLLGIPYLDAMAIAELGFIVVQIDGRGLPYRSKAFQDESYGRIGLVSNLDDHVAGIKQLAERFPYIDLDKVGIDSNLAGMGGLGAVEGLLGYPDFYKVGVTGCISDSRFLGGQMWGEKFEGLSNAEGFDSLAENFQGNLLIIHGMLDRYAAPAGAFSLIESLYKANKDPDMVLLPNHSHLMDTYFVRRGWDYFVKHLLNLDPPRQFLLSTPFDSFKMVT